MLKRLSIVALALLALALAACGGRAVISLSNHASEGDLELAQSSVG